MAAATIRPKRTRSLATITETREKRSASVAVNGETIAAGKETDQADEPDRARASLLVRVHAERDHVRPAAENRAEPGQLKASERSGSKAPLRAPGRKRAHATRPPVAPTPPSTLQTTSEMREDFISPARRVGETNLVPRRKEQHRVGRRERGREGRGVRGAQASSPRVTSSRSFSPRVTTPSASRARPGTTTSRHTSFSPRVTSSSRSRGSRAAVVGRPSRGGPARFGNGASAPFPFLGAACRQDAHDRLEERCTGVVVRIVEE